MNPKRPTPRNITIKMAKVKDKGRILKAAREKQGVKYRETTIRLSTEKTTGQKRVARYIKVLKGKYLQLTILYSASISFKIEDIKNFYNKQKLK